uniref:Uncharacterized protein n=1 Tax=Anguilla anguilla TaxID=7936 RepID=A0A0E9RWV5_ANGAN
MEIKPRVAHLFFFSFFSIYRLPSDEIEVFENARKSLPVPE